MRDLSLHNAFRRRLAAAALPGGPGDDRPVRAEEIDGLDEPVRRFMHFMGVVDRPRVWSFTVDFAGRFRLRPDGRWMPAAGRQYNSALEVGRVFTMRLRMARVVPMLGHDTYLSGVGRMRGKIAGLFTVADGSGTEFDVGELSTWLNDAVLLAPSMLLGAPTRWTATDHDTFEVTMDDSGHHVSATVVVVAAAPPPAHNTTPPKCRHPPPPHAPPPPAHPSTTGPPIGGQPCPTASCAHAGACRSPGSRSAGGRGRRPRRSPGTSPPVPSPTWRAASYPAPCARTSFRQRPVGHDVHRPPPAGRHDARVRSSALDDLSPTLRLLGRISGARYHPDATAQARTRIATFFRKHLTDAFLDSSDAISRAPE